MSLLVKNGRVIDPANGVDGAQDVLIAGEKVERVGKNLQARERGRPAPRARR